REFADTPRLPFSGLAHDTKSAPARPSRAGAWLIRFVLSRTACGSRASALRQRPRVLDAVPGAVEEHVDLPGEEQHGDGPQYRERRDDQFLLIDCMQML